MTEALFFENNGGLIQSIVELGDQIMCEQVNLKNLKANLQNKLMAAGFDRIENDNDQMMVVGITGKIGIVVKNLEKTGLDVCRRGEYLKVTQRTSDLKVEVLI